MKYYVIAGEASGDLHASNLIKALRLIDPESDFRGWGGDLMERQGVTIVRHYRDLAFMGFGEVIAHLPTILRNLSFCKKDILDYQPDVLILVDYPGFNLRIASFARKNDIRVFYYISPQVWAWKKSRVNAIRRDVDRMFVILPFEKDFYKSYGIEVDFVGHPLLDALENENETTFSDEDFRKANYLDQRPVIAFLPGSRKQEIARVLPVMLAVMEDFPGYQFVVAGVTSIPGSLYESIMRGSKARIVFDDTHAVLRSAYAALVTSGTATLETALLGVPEVVCYKGSNFSYQVAKRIVDIEFISLVNLIMERKVVEELIQKELNTQRLSEELSKILDAEHRSRIMSDYGVLHEKLGGTGASRKAATLMAGYLTGR